MSGTEEQAVALSDVTPGAAGAVYVADATSIEEFIVINETAITSDNLGLAWRIVGLPASWSLHDAGNGTAVIYDTKIGEVRMTITAPVVQDENGRKLFTRMDVAPSGDRFSLHVDTTTAQGDVLVDPDFQTGSLGTFSNRFCGTDPACSQPWGGSPPGWTYQGSNANYFWSGEPANGPYITAIGSSICANCYYRYIYTPASYIGMSGISSNNVTVRSANSWFGCGVSAFNGAWTDSTLATKAGAGLGTAKYWKSLSGSYSSAAMLLKNISGAARNAASQHYCSNDTGGNTTMHLTDGYTVNQDTPPAAGLGGGTFDPTAWYGPNKASVSIGADVSDLGSGVYYIKPIFRNAVGQDTANTSGLVICNGINVGPDANSSTRPCRMEPTPFAAGATLPWGSPGVPQFTQGTGNTFRWAIYDYSGRGFEASAVSLKWDSVRPTAPPSVSDGTSGESDALPNSNTIAANWPAASDVTPGVTTSGIAGYYYCMSTNITRNASGAGTGCSGTTVATGSSSTTSVTRSGLSLAPNTTYFVCVSAYDRSGNESAYVVCTNGARSDTASPTAVTSIIDGGSSTDIDFSSEDDAAVATYSGATDDAGVVSYDTCLTTTASGTDCASGAIVTWTPADDRFAEFYELQLSEGTHWRICVKAVDASGHRSPVACSNGVTVDASAPDAPTILDGPSADLDYSVGQGNQTIANWSMPVDAPGGSGVAAAYVCLSEVPSGTDCDAATATQRWTKVDGTSLTMDPSHLDPDTTYYNCIKSTDNAGNESSPACSDGYQRLGVTYGNSNGWASGTDHVRWSEDLAPGDAGADSYDYCLANSETGTDCATTAPVTWTSTSATSIAPGLNNNGDPMYPCVRSITNGIPQTTTCGTPVQVDDASPTPPTGVIDGLGSSDAAASSNLLTVSAKWTPGTDASSGAGIQSTEICVVTLASTCSADDWNATNGSPNSVVNAAELPFDSIAKACIRMVDKAGNVSPTTCSNGQAMTPSSQQTSTASAERALLGLDASASTVNTLLDSSATVESMGAPMTPTEKAAIDPALSLAEQAADIVADYGAAHPSDYAGVSFDPSNATRVIASFTANAASAEAAIDAQVGNASVVSSRTVANTLTSLASGSTTVSTNAPSLASRGIHIAAASPEIGANKIQVEVNDPTMTFPEGSVADVVAASTGVSASTLSLAETPETATTAAKVDKATYGKVRKKAPAGVPIYPAKEGAVAANGTQSFEYLAWMCTSNISLKGGGRSYMLTAYHCVKTMPRKYGYHLGVGCQGSSCNYGDQPVRNARTGLWELPARIGPAPATMLSPGFDAAVIPYQKNTVSPFSSVYRYTEGTTDRTNDVTGLWPPKPGAAARKYAPIAPGKLVCMSAMNTYVYSAFWRVCGPIAAGGFKQINPPADRVIPKTFGFQIGYPVVGCSGDSGSLVFTQPATVNGAVLAAGITSQTWGPMKTPVESDANPFTGEFAQGCRVPTQPYAGHPLPSGVAATSIARYYDLRFANKSGAGLAG